MTELPREPAPDAQEPAANEPQQSSGPVEPTPTVDALKRTGYDTAFDAAYGSFGQQEATEQRSQATKTEAEQQQAFAKQVELYKSNLQRKFGQKALETGIATMALVANIPGLKELSSYLRGARAILGTVSMGMLGGDLGRQIGLSNFSKEQGKKVAEFLERTKQFYNPDGTLRTLNPDEILEAQKLRNELDKQLELSAAVAKTTEHHRLFGRLIEEDIDKTASPESKGWVKEMASGIRSMFTKETARKVMGLAGKVTPGNVWNASRSIASAGLRNWKSLAWAGAPLAMMWANPVTAPAVLAGTMGINLYRKGSQLRELYKAHGAAEESVKAYRTYSFEGVQSVNSLAEQLIKLDKALGTSDVDATTEQLLAKLNETIDQDTYRDIAKAVRQAAAAGAGAGFAAGTAMYMVFGHQQEQTSHQPGTTPGANITPQSTEGSRDIMAPTPGSDPVSGDGTSIQAPIPDNAPTPHDGSTITAPDSRDIVAPTPNAVPAPQEPGNIAPPPSSWKDIPAPQPHPAEAAIPERVAVGDKLHFDIDGDGNIDTKGVRIQETYEVKLDAGGRKYIAMPYMDTNGDGKFDVLKPSAQEVAAGIKQKYVKVFVDRAASGGGYLGQEIHLMADGKEVAKDTLWVGDKDQWMREKVGVDTWNTLRERIKSSVGIDNHETKGWGFVARRGPLASLESAPGNAEGLQGSALEAAVRSQVPEIQITNYDAMAKTYSGNWLGGRGFVAEFVNTKTLPQLELDALTKGWAADQAFLLKDTALGVDATAFEFRHFSVASEKLRSFSKALLFSPSGLPTHLKETLRAIHENKQVASDALFDALKASKKREFTLDDLRTLAKAAKQAVVTRKG